jgi:hypothetical protein
VDEGYKVHRFYDLFLCASATFQSSPDQVLISRLQFMLQRTQQGTVFPKDELSLLLFIQIIFRELCYGFHRITNLLKIAKRLKEGKGGMNDISCSKTQRIL